MTGVEEHVIFPMPKGLGRESGEPKDAAHR
jgi:hypothetical protein